MSRTLLSMLLLLPQVVFSAAPTSGYVRKDYFSDSKCENRQESEAYFINVCYQNTNSQYVNGTYSYFKYVAVLINDTNTLNVNVYDNKDCSGTPLTATSFNFYLSPPSTAQCSNSDRGYALAPVWYSNSFSPDFASWEVSYFADSKCSQTGFQFATTGAVCVPFKTDTNTIYAQSSCKDGNPNFKLFTDPACTKPSTDTTFPQSLSCDPFWGLYLSQSCVDDSSSSSSSTESISDYGLVAIVAIVGSLMIYCMAVSRYYVQVALGCPDYGKDVSSSV